MSATKKGCARKSRAVEIGEGSSNQLCGQRQALGQQSDKAPPHEWQPLHASFFLLNILINRLQRNGNPWLTPQPPPPE
eukprot:scaffold176184_cov14-Tisochrysis_lutea.AAC.2